MNSSAIDFSIRDYLQLVRPDIPRSLISPEAMEDLERVAGQFPGLLTRFFGLECRLGCEERAADFLFSVNGKEAGQAILSGSAGQPRLPDPFLDHSTWKRVRRFCREWEKEGSSFGSLVDNVWLEFDVAARSSGLPVPSFFFGSDHIRSDPDPEGNRWVIEGLLPLLIEAELSSEVAGNISRCIQLLPEGARVFQFGLMMARPSAAFRICIRGMPVDQMGNYLEKIGWPGQQDRLRRFLAELAALVERVDLDIDAGREIGSKVGLECYLSRQPKFEPRWRLFCDRLIEWECCTREKAAGLLEYPGFVSERGHRSWPDYLQKGARLLGAGVCSVLFRRLHHIKVVHNPGAPLEAKAYLAVEHHWLNVELARKAMDLQSAGPAGGETRV